MYPRILKKGTIIRIGSRPGIMAEAIGLELEMPTNITIDREGIGYVDNAVILKNPIGWYGHSVSHTITLATDVILNGENKFNKQALERYDD